MKNFSKTNIATFASLSILTLAVPTFATAQGWETAIEGGLWATSRSSTDTTISDDPFYGAYIGGYARRDINQLRFTIDGRIEMMSDKGINDTYDTGPVHTGVLGLHLGREFGPTYVGAYAAFGKFDGYDESYPMDGYTIGIEAEHRINSRSSVFGQLGYLEAIGDPGDNEFKGPSARIGYRNQFSDRLGAMFTLDWGYSSDCFVDCGDQPGEYFGAGIEMDYALNDRLDLVGSIQHLRIEDYDDPDTGTDTSVYVGVRWNFGNPGRKNTLSTPITGFKAAGWMEPLD